MSKDRRKAPRYETAFIPVQLADVDGEMIDLSLSGAAVLHRSPVREGEVSTLIFPTYGGIYVPCRVLRSIVQVRRERGGPEYIFRSAITFLPMRHEEEGPLREFLSIQIERLRRMTEERA
ncbi:MAG TPA: PilZ domain-containing protein [Thermoanaerobaculia bacterium]|nr:PilZ domain-containing protein [Thermoanaerobaculia bacterium]